MIVLVRNMILWIVNGNSITFTPPYPHADEDVRVYFIRAPSTKKENECKKYIRPFLSSLFTSALDIAKILFLLGNVSYTDMAKMFYDFFADQRRLLRKCRREIGR